MSIDFKKAGVLILGKLRKLRDFFAISLGEAVFILLMFVIMLAINYFLITMNGFSLSYSKQWPHVSCVDDVFWLLFFLLGGHFVCRRSPWYLWSLTTVQFLILFVLLAIYLTTGTFFCESILYLVYDTTWEETKGFFSAYVSLKSILITVGVLAGYLVSSLWAMKMYRPEKKYRWGDLGALVVIILFLIYPSINIIKGGEWNVLQVMFDSHPANYIYAHISGFHNHTGQFIVEMRRRRAPDDVELQKEFVEQPPLGILIIGESAIRSHHAIYGYGRNTTPNLLRHKDRIVAFSDTIAVLPMTITALKYWLTDMTLENRHVKWTVFDVLKKVGYQVDVITNQNKSGWADSPLQMIFSSADSITYIHEENYSDLYEDRNAQIYDEALVAPFAQWLKQASSSNSKPMMAVLHLFGSHEPYSSRYPKDFSRIFLDDNSQSQVVNEYDTSLLYSDAVIGQILDMLNKLERPVYVIYLSDHGSVCKPSGLRTPGSVENSAYEIPFLIWTNRYYDQLVPETVERMKKKSDVPLQADRAHYGLLEIMGVELDSKCDKDNFLSDSFRLVPRTVREGSFPYVKNEDIQEKKID